MKSPIKINEKLLEDFITDSKKNIGDVVEKYVERMMDGRLSPDIALSLGKSQVEFIAKVTLNLVCTDDVIDDVIAECEKPLIQAYESLKSA